jgi:hypothetical protein
MSALKVALEIYFILIYKSIINQIRDAFKNEAIVRRRYIAPLASFSESTSCVGGEEKNPISFHIFINFSLSPSLC